MDIVELANQWLEKNWRRLQTGMMNGEEIAVSAFVAGYEAAQQRVQLTGLKCPLCNGSEMIGGKCRNCGVDGTPRN